MSPNSPWEPIKVSGYGRRRSDLNYFQDLKNKTNEAFIAGFHKRFGADYPNVTELAMGTYQGFRLWAEAVRSQLLPGPEEQDERSLHCRFPQALRRRLSQCHRPRHGNLSRFPAMGGGGQIG